MSDRMERRTFLRRSVLAAATGPAILASREGRPQVSPNERLVAALIGCGGMGTHNMRTFINSGEVDYAAVCDPDTNRREKAAAEVKNKTGRTPRVLNDFRKILDMKEVDFVQVSTPDHWHAIISIMAVQAGKHVFVEKPISHNINEGKAMVAAARRYKRRVIAGTQQRSGQHFLSAMDYLWSGALGKICLVRAWKVGRRPPLGNPPDGSPPPGVDYDMWLGPAPKRPFNPNRFHYQWRWFWDYAGGQLPDWGIHLVDIVHWGMKVDAPLAVAACGGRWIVDDNTETPTTMAAVYDYPNFTFIWEHRQASARPIENRDHGIAYYGENGTLVLTRNGWEVFSEGDRIANPPKSGGSEMWLAHVKHFLECLKTGKRARSEIDITHRSTTACQLGNIAFLVGRKIRWDREKEEIIDDPEANKLLSREYRKPWQLPKIA